jgi:DNA processing protein
VLPASPDARYPAWQRHLHARVLACGCAISDAAAGLRPATPQRHTAGARAPISAGLLAREALLAALADVTVVVEATRGAGALRTAEAALELGRTLAAVPGRTSDACAAGPNVLIRDGAHVVLEAADVLALLQADTRAPTRAYRQDPTCARRAAYALLTR